jgi:hypothetical protein
MYPCGTTPGSLTARTRCPSIERYGDHGRSSPFERTSTSDAS